MEALILIFSYLIGSLPSGFLAGKWFARIDLREVGSGSTGATNVLRHVGKWPAIAVFLVDVSKGIMPVVTARIFLLSDSWLIAAGLASLIGHIWPIWLGWKGGKAVATGLGMLLGISWPVGIACFGIFLAMLSITRIVSLSSVVAGTCLPLLMFLSFRENDFRLAYMSLSLTTMVLVLWRHRSNIKRLFAGQEPKIGQSRLDISN